jgi:DNA-binding NarL/FixJ family response regulator
LKGVRVLLNKTSWLTTDERLTQRESEVAMLLLQGLENKIIARELGLQVGTVKIHLHHIYRKLGVPNRRVFLFNNLSKSA